MNKRVIIRNAQDLRRFQRELEQEIRRQEQAIRNAQNRLIQQLRKLR